MTCEDVKRGMELPLDWHTPDKLREMWQHMSGCRTCNERYGWQFQLWWLMRDAMEEPPPGLADRIMLEVRAQKQPVVRRLPWWKRRRTLAAFAAALAVVVLSPAALRAIRSGLPMQAMQSETAEEGQMQSNGGSPAPNAASQTGTISSAFLMPSQADAQNQDRSYGDMQPEGGQGVTLSSPQEPESGQESENVAIPGTGDSDRTSPVAENDLFAGQGAWRTYASAKHTLTEWQSLLPTEYIKDPSQVTVVVYVAVPPGEYLEHVQGDAVDCYVVEAAAGYALYLVHN